MNQWLHFLLCSSCVVMVFLFPRHNDADIPFTQLLFFSMIMIVYTPRWLCVPITLNFKWIYFTELECRIRIRILCCVFHFPSHLSLINTRIYAIASRFNSNLSFVQFCWFIWVNHIHVLYSNLDCGGCIPLSFLFLAMFHPAQLYRADCKIFRGLREIASRTATNEENPSVAIKFLIHPHHYVIFTWIVFKTDFLLFSARQLPNSSITFKWNEWNRKRNK